MNINKLINMTFTRHALERGSERELYYSKKSLLKYYREGKQISDKLRFNEEKNIMFVVDRYTKKVVTMYRDTSVTI